ncbi:MAG: peptidase M17, partial [Desulfobulbaceae bacterium]|nr:peptidase M17 [Desulfobulbaceae bacterium]
PGVNVVGMVPATENLAGSAAIKPGDVVRHYGGLHAEVVNTDAEGRLILADAIAYGIATYSPDAVIDIATLTGAAVVGLGHHYSCLLANDEQLSERLLKAGQESGEPLWRLPLGPEYRKQLDSTVADIKNAGDRSGGTITAACYLQEFVGTTPWAHVDIAGTAWNFTEKSYVPKGASGTGVRTLLRALANWEKLNHS